MKILKSLVLVVLVAVAFTGCNKDETTLPAPVITFLNGVNEASVNSGGSHTIAGNIASEEGLTEVKYFQVTATGETQLGQAVTSFDNANSYSFQKTINDVSVQTVIKVMATDKKNQSSVLNFTIKVNGASISSYNNITLGAQTNATIGSSFASLNGLVYNLTDAKTNANKIDVIFFYGTTNLATLSAPSNTVDLDQVFTTASKPSTWTVQNGTKLEKRNTLDFTTITTGTQIPSVETTGTAKVSSVAIGDVILFRTAATSAFPNKNGVLKVTALSGNSGTATITFDVKIAN